MQAHLGAHLHECLGEELVGTHPGFQQAERLFYRLATDPHDQLALEPDDSASPRAGSHAPSGSPCAVGTACSALQRATSENALQ